MLDEYLVAHCSPTLASIKPANLFTVSLEQVKDLEKSITLCLQGKAFERGFRTTWIFRMRLACF